MKKFSFSLQRLLDYTEQTLDIERATLSNMNAVLNSFINELAAMKQERRGRVAEYDEKNAHGTTPHDMGVHVNYLRKLDEDIHDKEVQIVMQRRVVEKQTDKVRDIRLEISTMEKLKENKLAEYNYLDNKEQELFINEFVSYGKAVGEG